MTSVRFAFTVTLKPKHYLENPEVQYDRTIHSLYSIVTMLAKEITCIAELTKNGNIHYHGMITMPVQTQSCEIRFKNAFRKSKDFGFINFKQCNNDEGWAEYMSKNLTQTMKDIGRPPILKDQFRILDTTILNRYHSQEWDKHIHRDDKLES